MDKVTCPHCKATYEVEPIHTEIRCRCTSVANLVNGIWYWSKPHQVKRVR